MANSLQMGATSSARRGFTLLEVMIAVTIVGLVAGVLLGAHLRVQRAGETARLLTVARFQAEQLATRTRLGTAQTGWLADSGSVWQVTPAPFIEGNEAARLRWRKWQIEPTNRPALTTIVYLRQ
mgnify:CR=1 FL=1